MKPPYIYHSITPMKTHILSIPELLNIKPEVVRWKAGGEPDTKKINIDVG